jgi:hypothetical protein
MYFTAYLSRLSDITTSTVLGTSQYPFPYSGRFRVRITGYQLCYGNGATVAGDTSPSQIAVTSRTLVNPLNPYVFRCLPTNVNNNSQSSGGYFTSGWSATGWWECDLNGSIDLTLTPVDAGKQLLTTTLILHFELQRVEEGFPRLLSGQTA